MFLDMLLLSRVECGMKRKLHYYFITSLLLVYMQYTNMLKFFNSIVVHSSKCLNVRSVTRFALQVTSNYSKMFSNCGINLYMGNTFNDAIPCLKMHINLYTRLTYTQVYTITKKNETQKIKQYQGCESPSVKTKKDHQSQ